MPESLLERAKANRETVLLAELGAWLHDLGKLSSKFVLHFVDKTIEWDHEKIFSYDENTISCVLRNWLKHGRLENGHTSLESLIQGHHHSDWETLTHWQRLLVRADGNESGEDEYNASGSPQCKPVQRATVFGREDELDLPNMDAERLALYAQLEPCLTTAPYDRDAVWKLLRAVFNNGLGKTQRAANDIRLDQHVWGVASRFKAFVARDLLDPPEEKGGKPEIRNKFRILTVQWDSWEAITPFARLSDVAGRVALLVNVRDALRHAIETEYAIGNRIYEDDDGIHFLVADLEWGNELDTLVYKIVNEKSGGELLPVVTLSDPTERVTLLAHQMAEARKTLPIVGAPEWTTTWQGDVETEVCPVCRRRPAKIVDVDGQRQALPCKFCEDCREAGLKQRQAGGDKPSTDKPGGTLWNGEIADARGKTALIVARFDLEDWLKGDFLHTLFITSPQDMIHSYPDMMDLARWQCVQAGARELLELKGSLEPIRKYRADIKGISEEYQRLQQNPRVKSAILLQKAQALEAAKERFWAAVITGVGQEHGGEVRERVDFVSCELKALYPEIGADDAYFTLALARKNPSAERLLRVWQTTEEFLQKRAEALELAVGEKRERIVFALEGRPPGGIWTAEVPGLGEVELFVRPREDDKAQFTQAQTIDRVDKNQIPTIQAAIARDGRVRLLKLENARPGQEPAPRSYRVTSSAELELYIPFQVITVSPNLLLAMVPADKALAIAQEMQTAYAAEFSKVQGRLPFHVGLVFMDAHYPMFAALDAARRFAETFDELANGRMGESANGESTARRQAGSCDDLSGRWAKATVEGIALENDGKDYILQLKSDRFGTWQWRISARLGNDAPDHYHPYMLVKNGDHLEERGMSLRGPYGRWVHVSQVQAGDTIGFLPNLFDFISLDTVSRRLEARLDPKTRDRRPPPLLGARHSPRPYLLERVGDLATVWETICDVPGMSESRLQAATTLLARKWEAWELAKNPAGAQAEPYRWLVEKTVAQDFNSSEVIHQAILHGSYFDVIDLYRHILKQPIQKSKTQTKEEEVAS